MNERKKATVKLIPRIDLQAMAAKFVRQLFASLGFVGDVYRCLFRTSVQLLSGNC